MPGSSTRSPCSSAGAITMKMIRRTRTTSTSGVTLMSGVASRRFFALAAVGSAVAMRVLQLVVELAGTARELGLDGVDLVVQLVEEENGRDGDTEAERGLDERLRDAGADRAETAG